MLDLEQLGASSERVTLIVLQQPCMKVFLLVSTEGRVCIHGQVILYLLASKISNTQTRIPQQSTHRVKSTRNQVSTQSSRWTSLANQRTNQPADQNWKQWRNWPNYLHIHLTVSLPMDRGINWGIPWKKSTRPERVYRVKAGSTIQYNTGTKTTFCQASNIYIGLSVSACVGLCVDLGVKEEGGGGWSDRMHDSYFQCVRKYARVSIQCLLSMTVVCTNVLVYTRECVFLRVRYRSVENNYVHRYRCRLLLLRFCFCFLSWSPLLFWCKLLTQAVTSVIVRSV